MESASNDILSRMKNMLPKVTRASFQSDPIRTSFEDRLSKCDIPLMKKLYQIMIDKRTNLCVAADFKAVQQVIKLADMIGPHICMLKLHSGFQGGTSENSLEALYNLKRRHNFLLFEDRKFFDGRETVILDYQDYVKYVDIVTVVPDFGDAMFDAIKTVVDNTDLPDDEHRGCLAVCELSFKDIIRPDPEKLYRVAERNSPICIGIIAQKLKVKDQSRMIKATPGINMSQTSDGKSQQWRGPESAIADGTDIIIVGRGITAKPEDQWEATAREYKDLAYKAYLDACKSS